MENWRAVEGTDGMIEISDLGRIRSNLRDGRILKPTEDKKGYLRIKITLNRVHHSYKVHRMVAEAFIPNPEGKAQVNHKDGNKKNNAVSNLEWVSNAENMRHAYENGLNRYHPEENNRRKTPVVAVNAKTGEKLRFESVSDAERYFNSRHISDVLKGKRDKAAGHFFYREGVVA